jgi:hypothetical protein
MHPWCYFDNRWLSIFPSRWIKQLQNVFLCNILTDYLGKYLIKLID